MRHKLGLIICENYRKELETALKTGGYDDVFIETFPANCRAGCNREKLERDILVRHPDCNRLEWLGGCCLKNRAQPTKADERGWPYRLDTCFEMFLPQTNISHYIQQGAYLITPGWLNRWPEQIAEWGFNRETAVEFFAEFCAKLLLLDTQLHPDSHAHLSAFADFLRLPYEIVPVGLETLRLLIAVYVGEWRWQNERQEVQKKVSEINQQAADYAMTFNLIGDLTQLITEAEVVERIFNLFAALFAPSAMQFTSIVDHQPQKLWAYPSASLSEPTPYITADLENGHQWAENDQGFSLRIEHDNHILGLLDIAGLTFPERKQEYLNLALTLVNVCGLAIANARALRGILPICANCKKIRDSQEQWHPLEVYILEHSEIDFSHGLCPECTMKLYPGLF
jgi:hypothetical protein